MILDVTAVAVLDNGKPRASGDDPNMWVPGVNSGA